MCISGLGTNFYNQYGERLAPMLFGLAPMLYWLIELDVILFPRNTSWPLDTSMRETRASIWSYKVKWTTISCSKDYKKEIEKHNLQYWNMNL